jgi:hypothetical protein
MSPLREGVILPALFLTVTLLGGLRIAVDGGGVRLLPPPLLALVLAMLLLGTLARGHVLVPAALLSASRRPLENLSGAIVLMTLFAASTQAINVVLPERGLLHAAVGVLLFVQLMTMTAGAAGRAGMLRSLLVLLGSLFVLRFVVFESLYAQEAGTLKRVLTALMAGVTLGGIEYEPNAAATGYVAFLTLALYVTGLVLMPAAVDGEVVDTALARAPSEPRLPRTLTIVCVATAIGASLTGCRRSSGPEPAAAGGEIAGPQRSSPSADRKPTWTPEHREGALRAARVWRQPAVPIAQADLGRNPPGAAAFTPDDVVECQLLLEPVGGTTPKFNCRLRDGTRVRVKYGDVNPEIFAEVAATRLLSALGFGADRMYVVRAIRCAGCPRDPFQALQCLARAGVEDACFRGGVDYERTVDIDPAVIERQVPGTRIEAAPDQGWAWFELDRIDPAAGGSPRSEVDALRLMAVLLAHWDNKAENQRLICPPGSERQDGRCGAPLALIQDLGATFGPVKLDIHNWRATPIWADAASCRVSMKNLPYGGGTFPDHQISEEGRQHALRLLDALSARQLVDLFTAARVTSHKGLAAEGRRVQAWVDVFEDKVRQIRSGGPCPEPAA